jgi:isopentenyl-diphosphate delta-isomerase
VSEELLIAVDERDRPVGPRSRASCHRGQGLLHRALSVYLFDRDLRLLLQRRSIHKPLWPSYWANSCCSHPRWGEVTADAAHRRIGEELGLSVSVEHVFSFQYHARFEEQGAEHEFCHVFAGIAQQPAQPDPREVQDCAFVEPARLDEELEAHPDVYAPWLHMAWRALRTHHWQRIEELQVGSA